jgi:AraC-like DNA-binding protein
MVWTPPCVQHVLEALTDDLDFWVFAVDNPRLPAVLAELDPLQSSTLRSHTGCLELLSTLVSDWPVVELTSAYRDAIEQSATLCWQAYLASWRCGEPAADFSRGALPSARAGSRPSWMPPWPDDLARFAGQKLAETFRLAVEATLSEREGKPGVPARRAFSMLVSDSTLSRTALSRNLSVSEAYLSRAFQDCFGTGLADQRARLRMARFLDIARANSDGALERARAEAGFGSYAQLHRTFVRYTQGGVQDYLSGRGLARAAGIVCGDDVTWRLE